VKPIHRDFLWWQTGVIYQIYPRSFKDSNGDGVGDLAGIIHQLDYLSETLGIDAIWLSPIYPSPMADFGYDVADYTSVDPIFGDMEVFDRLVKETHGRGLKLIIDFVPNHTSIQHAWFQESIASRDNPKRDWYIWADPRTDGSPPNNWLSLFGGSAWELEPKTGQYYLHSFLKEQPDLNWRNPQVKEAMFDVIRFWLDRGVDGFRIDVAHFILKDPLLRDNPHRKIAGPDMHKSMGAYDAQVHLYDKDHPDTHEVYRELRQLLESYSADQPRFSIGEIHYFQWQKWSAYYGQNLDELHMPFNFHLLKSPWNARAVRSVVDAQETAIPAGAWPNYVLGNHDEPRLASRLGKPASRVAAMLLLTLRGTPTLYYGDEIGMADRSISPEERKDPFGIRVPGLGRDGCRTPMQWTSDPNAGFSAPETRQLWLPLGNDYQEINIARQLQETDSILNLYRQLLAYRKRSPALQMGQLLPIESTPSDCFAYIRKFPGARQIIVGLNFSSNYLNLQFNDLGQGEVVISTNLDRSGRIDLSDWVLRPNEGAIIELG
jgi:glycosidase